MPVSVVCDTAGVSAAIRDSIANSSSSANSNICGSGGGGGVSGGSITVQNDDQQSLQSKLVASAKRVLLTKVEYEEVTNYNQSFLDTLKSKYIVLKPSPSSTNGKSHSSSATNDKDTSSQQNQNTNSSCSSGTSYNTKDAHLTNPKKILFPRENVQIGWRSSGRKWHVGAGMINVGNTCYLNSTLQALFHVPAMANWLMSDSAHRDKCEDENGTQGGCIICAMSKTLIYSQTNQGAIRPHLVYTKLKMVCKHLVMGRQEDAHEFLRYLVEAMEKSYLARYRNSKELDQYSKETTPLNQILGGYLRSAVRCLACGHISTTFQHFEDLLLDIRKANTLDEALEGYFARERLEDMGYKCESCKKKVAATKQFSLERAPISLCIQLKRFSMMGTKLNKQVGIRTRLDLTPYATKKSSEPLIYRLVSMVTHLGASQHCGHYTAIGLTESGTYYQFDDSCVRALTIQNVLNTSAYIMFYELEDSLQRSKQTSTITSREYYEQLKDTTSNTKINGLTDHNDNISRQYSTMTSTNSVLSLNSKPSSKLEINNQSAFIGPQLPDKIPLPYKESSDSHNSTNSNIQTSMNGDLLKTKQNGYVLNNSTAKLVTSPNKLLTKQNGTCISTNGTTSNNSSNTTNNINSQNTSSTSASSSSNKLVPVQVQKSNQTIVDKLLNHLKSGNNNSNNNNNSNSNSIRSNGNGNLEVNDPTNKQSSIFDSNRNAKMESPIKNGDTHTQNNKLYSPKDNQVAKSRRSETPTYTNGNHGANSASKSLNSSGSSSYTERSKNLIRSLVPYESDDENDEENDEHMNDSYISDTGSKSNKKRSRSIKRGSKKSNNYNSDNESTSSCESYTTKPRKKLTPPSPPVVESKTGYWQVETISTPNRTPLVSPSSSATTATPVTPIQERDSKKNSFHSPTSHTAISPDNFYSSNALKFKEKSKLNNHKMNGNGNGHYNDTTGGDNGVVDELTRQSHRGYGAPVLSWNGHKSNMDKEVTEEKRLERKRELVEDEENEMDRGRQKKVKMAGPIGRDNPGYNPFQEYQNQYQNNNNRRWNNGGRYHNGPVYRQNPHYHHHHHHNNNNNNNNHHHHHNRNNNFRRNRFHQRPHHQRNGDSSSYHRRDS